MSNKKWPIAPTFLSLRIGTSEETANYNEDGVYFVDYLRGFLADLSHDRHIQNALTLFQFVPQSFVPLDSNALQDVDGKTIESTSDSITTNHQVYDCIKEILKDRKIIRIESGTYVNNGVLCDYFRRCKTEGNNTNKDFCFMQDSLVGIFAAHELELHSPMSEEYGDDLQRIVNAVNEKISDNTKVNIERVERKDGTRYYLHYTCRQSLYEEHVFPIYSKGRIVACLMLGQMARGSYNEKESFVSCKEQFKLMEMYPEQLTIKQLSEQEWEEKEKTIIDRIEIFERRLEDRINQKNEIYLNDTFEKIEENFQKNIKSIDVKDPYISDVFFEMLSRAFSAILNKFDEDNTGFIRMFAISWETESKRLLPIGWSGADKNDYSRLINDYFFNSWEDNGVAQRPLRYASDRIIKERTSEDVFKPQTLVGDTVSFIVWKRHPQYLMEESQRETFSAYKKCLRSFYKLAMQCYAYLRGARLEFVLETTIRTTAHESAHFIQPAIDVVNNKLSVLPREMVLAAYAIEYVDYCKIFSKQKADVSNALQLLDKINSRPSMIFKPLELKRKDTMLFPLLFSMVMMMSDRAEGNDMFIRYTQKESYFSANIDETYINHAVFNLLDNAIKYAYDGSNILVSMYPDKAQRNVIIEVTSYGIGIKDGDRIYDLFFRGTTVLTTNMTGMGIGMFLVKKICLAHGGDISHSSTLVSEMNVPVLFALPKKSLLGKDLTEEEKKLCEKECERLSSLEQTIVNTSSFVKYPNVFKVRIFQPTYKNVFKITLPLI